MYASRSLTILRNIVILCVEPFEYLLKNWSKLKRSSYDMKMS